LDCSVVFAEFIKTSFDKKNHAHPEAKKDAAKVGAFPSCLFAR
jgi:hypothetical protein